MTEVTINGIPHQPAATSLSDSSDLTPDRLRALLQDSHVNFLIGAGTPSAFFARLGNIEEALTDLSEANASAEVKALVRASIQGYFFENVLVPNLRVMRRDASARSVLKSYATFLRTLNRILLKRHSSLLAKQANIFTTNVDMVFEVALEILGMDYSDGFSGKIRPRFDLGDFGTLRFRMGSRYEHRSELPVVNLYKLHGSAAWRQVEQKPSRDDIFFDHELALVASVNESFKAAKPHLLEITDPDDVDAVDLISKVSSSGLPPEVTAFTTAYDALGIVNPDKTKFATTVLNETYYELIRRFANELEKENSVLFVHGFSFRDEHLRDLVLRAARTNPTLQVVIFCYSRADWSAYARLLPEDEVKNGNILYVQPAEPEDPSSERSIALDVLEADFFAPVIADRLPQTDQRIELDIRTEAGDADGV
jgi:hypothetical protein